MTFTSIINKVTKLCSSTMRRLRRVPGLEGSEKIAFSPFVREFLFPSRPIKFWIANRDAEKWYQEENWSQAAEYHELKRMVQSGDRILEVGSHHGFTGLLLSEMAGPTGFVLGLEAQPANAIVAMAQVTLNPHVRNLRFLHGAGGATEGSVTISNSHNSWVLEDDASGQAPEVRTVTGDALNRELGPFDVLKVDVEGFECFVLRGCRELLNSRPKMAIELHIDLLARYGSTVSEFLNLIDAVDCQGSMLIRSGSQTAVPFDPAALPSSGIVNLFVRRNN